MAAGVTLVLGRRVALFFGLSSAVPSRPRYFAEETLLVVVDEGGGAVLCLLARETLGVALTGSSVATRAGRLDVRRPGVSVGSGSSTSGSSRSVLLPWLGGTSTMPLVERLVRDWAFRSFVACGEMFSRKRLIRSGFFAEEGYATSCATRIDLKRGTVRVLGSKSGSRYAVSSAMAMLDLSQILLFRSGR